MYDSEHRLRIVSLTCDNVREAKRERESVRAMNMRKIGMVALLATLICVRCAAPSGVDATDVLFMKTASGATLNGMVTLTGVANDVTYFSYRPVRVVGRVATEAFLSLFKPQGTFSEVCTCPSHTYCVSSCHFTPSSALKRM